MNNLVNGFEKAKGDAMSPLFGLIFTEKVKNILTLKNDAFILI